MRVLFVLVDLFGAFVVDCGGVVHLIGGLVVRVRHLLLLFVLFLVSLKYPLNSSLFGWFVRHWPETVLLILWPLVLLVPIAVSWLLEDVDVLST